jgi:leucyl/phenylalanyl-tRNA--protein transferase
MPPFTVENLIACYELGLFPMADSRDDDEIYLVEPERRGVLPLDAFHVPHRLARTVRSDRFQVRIDTAFEAVLDGCAASRPDRPDTWINATIRGLYLELHGLGLAHSVETWREDRLVGGLYGVALGGAFFGESMFSVERDASKVALVHLVARLIARGFVLLDAQFITEHLTQFGAREIPREAYLEKLAPALEVRARFGGGQSADGAGALQLITQAS